MAPAEAMSGPLQGGHAAEIAARQLLRGRVYKSLACYGSLPEGTGACCAWFACPWRKACLSAGWARFCLVQLLANMAVVEDVEI